MDIEFHDRETSRQIIREKVASRKWWVIIATSENDEGQRIAERVERTHYTGKASADFEVSNMTVPGGFLSIYFARKTQMNLTAFRSILSNMGSDARPSEQNDIVFGSAARASIIFTFFALVDAKAAKQFLIRTVRERVESGEWWTIVAAGGTETGRSFLEEIVAEVGDGDQEDFDSLVFGYSEEKQVGVAAFFLRKRRMTLIDLKLAASRWGMDSPEVLTKPIIFVEPLPEGTRQAFQHMLESENG